MGCLTMDAFSERARTCHQKRGGVGIFVHIPGHNTQSKDTAITYHLTAGLYISYMGTCLNEHNTIVSPPDGWVKAVIRNPV